MVRGVCSTVPFRDRYKIHDIAWIDAYTTGIGIGIGGWRGD